MAGLVERGGRGAGGSGEAQAQGQPRDPTMSPMQPVCIRLVVCVRSPLEQFRQWLDLRKTSLGPPRDEPRVFGLDKFNGDNFAEWSFRMENIFDNYDLLEVMEGTEKRPENDPEKSPWVRKSAQGYLLLGQALGSSQIRHIKPFQREPEKGPKAWAAFKGVHAPATAAVAVVLERQMAALRIEEDEAVEEGVQIFFDLLTRLEGADLNYSELQKKTKLLALLPESWSSLIINLNRDLPRLSLEDMKRAILQEDFRRRELASADDRGHGRGRGRGRGGGRFGSNNLNGGRGSGGYGSDNKSNGRGRGRFDGECHYCHKSGHMWPDCYKLLDGWTPAQGQEGRGVGGERGRGRGGRGGRGGGATSMKSAGNESESRDDRFPGQFFFVSTQAPAGPEKDEGFEEPVAVGKVTLHSMDYWVIDSGATYSMTPRADLLTELEPSPVKHVTSALGQRAEVKGMGKAMVKGADGKILGLKNVLWMPNLAANLISVRRLQMAGMDTSSKGAKTYTARIGKRILWYLHEDSDVYNEMWQIAATAKAPLDEVVMDVVGPLKLGAAGAEYFLTVVDIYTRMTWVYVLFKKSDVAETLSSSTTTTRKFSLVNEEEEAKDAEEEEEEVQQVSERASTLPSCTTSGPRIRVTPQQRQGIQFPAAEEEGRGKRRVQAPKRLTYDVLGQQGKSTLAGAAMMVGDDEESEYEECAFVFFSPVEMLGEPTTLKEALESSDAEEWKKAMESELKSIEENGTCKLLREVLEEIGFTPSSADHSLLMLVEGEQRSFMVVYVDDILIFSPSSDLVKEVMLKLQDNFKCKALGDVSFYLGLHIERDVEKRCMRVHQRKYLEELAANFGQSKGHMATPFPSGLNCVKGPEEESVVGLQYSAAAQRRQKGADGVEPGRLFLTAFSDASYASEPEDMTSVGGFICCVGGDPTSWESKKQVDQALSSVESEYMALFRAIREIVWQRRLLAELGEEQQGPTPLYCDRQGAIALAKNPVLHGLTKHMRVKWHWTRSMVAAGEVELRYVKTTGQPADMMTKKLVEQQHWKCCKLAGMDLN
ncbi:unnamed protein product [Closterium sp. NIES-54]